MGSSGSKNNENRTSGYPSGSRGGTNASRAGYNTEDNHTQFRTQTDGFYNSSGYAGESHIQCKRHNPTFSNYAKTEAAQEAVNMGSSESKNNGNSKRNNPSSSLDGTNVLDNVISVPNTASSLRNDATSVSIGDVGEAVNMGSSKSKNKGNPKNSNPSGSLDRTNALRNPASSLRNDATSVSIGDVGEAVNMGSSKSKNKGNPKNSNPSGSLDRTNALRNPASFLRNDATSVIIGDAGETVNVGLSESNKKETPSHCTSDGSKASNFHRTMLVNDGKRDNKAKLNNPDSERGLLEALTFYGNNEEAGVSPAGMIPTESTSLDIEKSNVTSNVPEPKSQNHPKADDQGKNKDHNKGKNNKEKTTVNSGKNLKRGGANNSRNPRNLNRQAKSERRDYNQTRYPQENNASGNYFQENKQLYQSHNAYYDEFNERQHQQFPYNMTEEHRMQDRSSFDGHYQRGRGNMGMQGRGRRAGVNAYNKDATKGKRGEFYENSRENGDNQQPGKAKSSFQGGPQHQPPRRHQIPFQRHHYQNFNETCPICSNPIGHQYFLTLHCNHRLHNKCALQSAQEMSNLLNYAHCPICRTPLFYTDSKQQE